MGWEPSCAVVPSPVLRFCRNFVPVPAALLVHFVHLVCKPGGLTGSAVVRYAWIVIMRKSRDYIYDIREIGRRIRLLRELKQVSQKELGDAVGLSRERFSKVEKGQSGLSVEVMMRVADYFGVPLEFLYFGEMREARLRGQLLAIARMLCLLAGEETEQEGKEAG